jgi:superoxide dismutase
VHHGKHHAAYAANLNKQIAGKEWDSKDLDAIVLASWNNGNPTPEFNNAAQVRIGEGVRARSVRARMSRAAGFVIKAG